jgi:hypothetical protein
MSNGLGAGFGALVLFAALSGLALLSTLATAASYAGHRQARRLPSSVRYLFVLLGVAAVAVAGFGVLTLFDEAPSAAGLFLLLGFLPLLGAGVALHRRTELAPVTLAATTTMAWGPPFLVGVCAAFGTMAVLIALLDVPAAAASETGLPWIAAAVGGVVVVVGTVLLGTRLVDVARAAGSDSSASHRIFD